MSEDDMTMPPAEDGTVRSYLKDFSMPKQIKITDRLTSVTNAFVNSIIPFVKPTEEQVEEALRTLGMLDRPACAYCGDLHTEWDHLQPLVVGRAPTGYISEIDNLVPACGKCNQSKGNRQWKTWILSTAPRSPTTRGIADLAERVRRLEAYEQSTNPTKLDFAAIVGADRWGQHLQNLDEIKQLMTLAEAHAAELRTTIRDEYDARSSA